MNKNNLKNIRKSKGLTQSQLAEKVDVETPTVARHETGKRDMNIEAINKYAEALDCQPYELLVDKEDFLIISDKKEEAFMKMFRKLSDQDQERIIQMAETWADKANERKTS